MFIRSGCCNRQTVTDEDPSCCSGERESSEVESEVEEKAEGVNQESGCHGWSGMVRELPEDCGTTKPQSLLQTAGEHALHQVSDTLLTLDPYF